MTGRRGADDLTHEVARLSLRPRACRPDALLVAEHNHDAGTDLDRDGWHGTMNYAGFTRPLWTWLRGARPGRCRTSSASPAACRAAAADAVARSMRSAARHVVALVRRTPGQLLGSHDTPAHPHRRRRPASAT